MVLNHLPSSVKGSEPCIRCKPIMVEQQLQMNCRLCIFSMRLIIPSMCPQGMID